MRIFKIYPSQLNFRGCCLRDSVLCVHSCDSNARRLPEKSTVVGIGISLLFASLTGCSMLPYENDYSCRLKDNYGKCISVQSAYDEAVTGESQGEPMKPKSKQRFGSRSNGAEKQQMTPPSGNAYQNYRDRTYQQLGELIKQPNTPLLQPPKVIRTLVVSYSPSSKQDTLYMPRYVYTVIQDPKWVLGQYLHGKPELIKSLVDTREVNS